MCTSWYSVYYQVFLKQAKEINVNRYNKLANFVTTCVCSEKILY